MAREAPDRARLFNWAAKYRYRARRVHRPSIIDDVRGLVARLPRVRVPWLERQVAGPD